MLDKYFNKSKPNDYLTTEIILENDDHELFVGETRTGKIFFTPKMNLVVTRLGYQFVLEAKGNKH